MKDVRLCSILGCNHLRVAELPYCSEHILNRRWIPDCEEPKYIRSFFLSAPSYSAYELRKSMSYHSPFMYIVMSCPSDFKAELLSEDTLEVYNDPNTECHIRRPQEVPALMRAYLNKWNAVYPLGDERDNEKHLIIDKIVLSKYM